MSDIINETVQSFSPGELVTLYQLDAALLGGPVYYFTPMVVDGAMIEFDGQVYTPIDIHAEGFEWNGRGALPTPKIRISNAGRIMSAALITYGDLIGAELTRIRTFRHFLDDGSDPDPTATFPLDVFTVERKVTHNKIYIEWELSAIIDQQGKMFPGRQVLKDACTHVYRTWNGSSFDYTNATCPYTGTDYFTRSDVRTTSQSGDECGKRLTSCRLRFGEHGHLPTRAFPGVGDPF